MKTVKVLSGPFRGTPVTADWQGGKRKILGIYEHELNSWWCEKLKDADLFYDVGAADGYFTRGVAHKMRHREIPRVIGFEPGLEETQLETVKAEHHFKPVDFQFIPKLVGASDNDNMATLDSHYHQTNRSAIVKIDVEGAELEVLSGADEMLSDPRFHWTVEIHGRDLIDPVTQVFEARNRKFKVIEPRPHWLFGPENRSEWTGWLVTL